MESQEKRQYYIAMIQRLDKIIELLTPTQEETENETRINPKWKKEWIKNRNRHNPITDTHNNSNNSIRKRTLHR